MRIIEQLFRRFNNFRMDFRPKGYIVICSHVSLDITYSCYSLSKDDRIDSIIRNNDLLSELVVLNCIL